MRDGADPERPRVGISACLLGHEVRWDGGHKRDALFTDTLGRQIEWVRVCPEVELGLGTPRETIRLEGDARAPRLVAPGSGTDHTEAMERLARARVDALAREGLAGFVLKKDSPSCGRGRVPVFGGSSTPSPSGVGAFARVLTSRLPLLPVEEEDRLHDPWLCENFVERLFAYVRWQRFRAGRPTCGELVRFHGMHERQLRTHAPAACARLGGLVLRAEPWLLDEVLDAYGRGFMEALWVRV